jgi:ABC-2 type transport system ATP-binding protein
MPAKSSPKVIIDFENVSKNAGNKQILKSISIEVREGEMRALIGPNGAGKTTLLMIAAGLIRPSSGRVIVNGSPSTEPLGCVYYLQDVPNKPVFLKVRELMGFTTNCYRSTYDEKTIQLLGISSLLDQKFGSLSRGEKQRVDLALALLSGAEVLLLDEFLGGLDVDVKEEVISAISSLKGSKTMVVSSHELLERIIPMSDTTTLINNGKVVVNIGSKDLVKKLQTNGLDISHLQLDNLLRIFMKKE